MPTPLSQCTPVLLGRIPRNDKQQAIQAHTPDLLEEGVLVLLRQHCPSYFKLNGYAVRCALNRAFVRFLLERTRGNQARGSRRIQP